MPTSRRKILFALKSILALVIVAAVAWQFCKILSSEEIVWQNLNLRWEYLLASGVLYLLAHTLWGTFFYQLLRYEGAEVPWLVGLRTYFVSQFGKYVPGKAWVILLRVALLRKHKVSATVVGVCGTYETLVSMAAGAMLGVSLFPWLGLNELPQKEAGPTLRFSFGSWEWVILAMIAGLPLVMMFFNKRLMKRLLAKRGPDAPALPCPSFALLLQGLLQATVGWCFLGLSLWFTVNSVTTQETPFTGQDYAEAVAAVCVSYVAGFAAFLLPGGLGVREAILQRVLVKHLLPVVGTLAAPLSVVIAVVLRLVWTVFEVAFAALLYFVVQPQPRSDIPPAISSSGKVASDQLI